MAELVTCTDCGEEHEDIDLLANKDWFACKGCGSNNLIDEFDDSYITKFPKEKYKIKLKQGFNFTYELKEEQ